MLHLAMALAEANPVVLCLPVPALRLLQKEMEFSEVFTLP